MDTVEMHNAYTRATHEAPIYENIDIDREVIKRWLATKHSTLWSTWAIDDEKGRDRASEWFYKEIESLAQFMMLEMSHS